MDAASYIEMKIERTSKADCLGHEKPNHPYILSTQNQYPPSQSGEEWLQELPDRVRKVCHLKILVRAKERKETQRLHTKDMRRTLVRGIVLYLDYFD